VRVAGVEVSREFSFSLGLQVAVRHAQLGCVGGGGADRKEGERARGLVGALWPLLQAQAACEPPGRPPRPPARAGAASTAPPLPTHLVGVLHDLHHLPEDGGRLLLAAAGGRGVGGGRGGQPRSSAAAASLKPRVQLPAKLQPLSRMCALSSGQTHVKWPLFTIWSNSSPPSQSSITRCTAAGSSCVDCGAAAAAGETDGHEAASSKGAGWGLCCAGGTARAWALPVATRPPTDATGSRRDYQPCPPPPTLSDTMCLWPPTMLRMETWGVGWGGVGWGVGWGGVGLGWGWGGVVVGVLAGRRHAAAQQHPGGAGLVAGCPAAASAAALPALAALAVGSPFPPPPPPAPRPGCPPRPPCT
jgi:hypothetical protein